MQYIHNQIGEKNPCDASNIMFIPDANVQHPSLEGLLWDRRSNQWDKKQTNSYLRTARRSKAYVLNDCI